MKGGVLTSFTCYINDTFNTAAASSFCSDQDLNIKCAGWATRVRIMVDRTHPKTAIAISNVTEECMKIKKQESYELRSIIK